MPSCLPLLFLMCPEGKRSYRPRLRFTKASLIKYDTIQIYLFCFFVEYIIEAVSSLYRLYKRWPIMKDYGTCELNVWSIAYKGFDCPVSVATSITSPLATFAGICNNM